MKVQAISNDTAESVWRARWKEIEIDHESIQVDHIGEGDLLLSDYELENTIAKLSAIQDKYKNPNWMRDGGKLDSELTQVIHAELSDLADVHALSQIGFWRWLSNLASNGFFWHFIQWRFPGDKLINWGITSSSQLVEVYFFRCWLRGHKMFDPSQTDPYKYAKKGLGDVWRSHILRQDYGSDREFIKAFLDIIYDDDGKTLVNTNQLRTVLIPAVRAWTSSATYAHLTYEENLKLLRSFLNND